jgi:hypothetical protein
MGASIVWIAFAIRPASNAEQNEYIDQKNTNDHLRIHVPKMGQHRKFATWNFLRAS